MHLPGCPSNISLYAHCTCDAIRTTEHTEQLRRYNESQPMAETIRQLTSELAAAHESTRTKSAKIDELEQRLDAMCRRSEKAEAEAAATASRLAEVDRELELVLQQRDHATRCGAIADRRTLRAERLLDRAARELRDHNERQEEEGQRRSAVIDALLNDIAATPAPAPADRARVEELEKDKARLDWLDENMGYHGGGNGGTYSFKTPADVECGMLRAAIDAAITLANPQLAKIKAGGLSAFWNAQAEWSQATFGLDSERGPIGPLKHLAKEAIEAQENPTDLMEFVDCLFLTFDATRRAGFTFDQLLSMAWQKLAINKARKWGKPLAGDQPVEHDRSQDAARPASGDAGKE